MSRHCNGVARRRWRHPAMANAGAAPTRVEHARQRFSAGDTAAARRECEAILKSARDGAERAAAHLLLAACCRKDRDMDAALAHARAALADTPRDPVAHYAMAELQEAAGDAQAAVTSVERSLSLNPRFVQAHHYLGVLRGEAGDMAGAAVAFEQALRLDPGHARSWNNLGNAQRTLGRLDDAERSFARAVASRPDYPLAVANLAGVQRDLGETERAEATLRQALARMAGQTPYRPLLVLLAGLLRERGELDEAAQLYLQAIQAAPDQSGGEWFNLGSVLGERGDPERAREAYARAYATNRNDLRGLIAKNLGLPMIYADTAALDAARTAFGVGLAALGRDLDTALAGLSEAQVLDGLRWTNFFLAYQGCNDRELQADYAALASARARHDGANLARTDREATAGGATHARRLRVGILPCRHLRPVFQELDHRPRPRSFRGGRLPPLSRDGRSCERDRAPRRPLSRVRRQQGASVGRRAGHSRRRPRRARLSRARDGRDIVCAGCAAARAAAIRRLGTSGDDRPRDDRCISQLRIDGTRRRRGALRRALDPAPGHRHAVRASTTSPRTRPASSSASPTVRCCCCARNRCSRSTRRTTRCSPSFLRRTPRRYWCSSRAVIPPSPISSCVDSHARWTDMGSRSGNARACCPRSVTTIICVSTSSATRWWTRCTGRAAIRASMRWPAVCRSSRCPERSCAAGRARQCCRCSAFPNSSPAIAPTISRWRPA